MRAQLPTRPATPANPTADHPAWPLGLSTETALPALARIALVALAAFLAYRTVTILTRRLEREIEEEDPLVKRLREQRARTIAGLINNIALGTILTLAGLTILGTFIDIRPLLAGAGIAGLAISFGAQSLVKDILSGFFILLEGQFGIGDVVRVGDTSGMVEKISLRTTILRDLHGAVHIIPNGEINRLTNLTKSWARAVVDVTVDYKEDTDHVLDVLRDIARELHTDPAWAPVLLETPEVLGIEQFADSGLTLRILAKTLPLKQWDVARELRRRIKNRFDREGIQIPFPHVTIYWGEGQAPAWAHPGRTA